jgi:hypothetical protein
MNTRSSAAEVHPSMSQTVASFPETIHVEGNSGSRIDNTNDVNKLKRTIDDTEGIESGVGVQNFGPVIKRKKTCGPLRKRKKNCGQMNKSKQHCSRGGRGPSPAPSDPGQLPEGLQQLDPGWQPPRNMEDDADWHDLHEMDPDWNPTECDEQHVAGVAPINRRWIGVGTPASETRAVVAKISQVLSLITMGSASNLQHQDCLNWIRRLKSNVYKAVAEDENTGEDLLSIARQCASANQHELTSRFMFMVKRIQLTWKVDR